jgi:hypothetical protein
VSSLETRCESWNILLHSVEPPLDHESTVLFVDVCIPIILPRVMSDIELFLTTCVFTFITKLTQPVMFRSLFYPSLPIL